MKIPVYFMPGLATSPLIFEHIELKQACFEVIFLEWDIPLKSETLAAYAYRMSQQITHTMPVLVGVSFGGVLVQEIAKFIEVRKVIIISSIKSKYELPRRFQFARKTKIYKLLPLKLLLNLDFLIKLPLGKKINNRLRLYDNFFSVRDLGYLKWSIEQIILWDRGEPDETVIHIHGGRDQVFPIRCIEKCTVLEGGTHIMILNKTKWISAYLSEILSNELEQ